MEWRRWLEDELHGVGAVVAVVLAALLAVAGWLGWSLLRANDPAVVERTRPLAAVSSGVRASSPDVAASMPAEALAPAPDALPACPHQYADLLLPERHRERACLSAMRSRQTGSLRTHQMTSEGQSSWQLALDVADEQIVSVRLRRPAVGLAPEAFYACDAEACADVSFGRPDASGVRIVKLDGTVLQALPAGQRWRARLPRSSLDKAKPAEQAAPPAAAALPSVQIVASLRTESDLQASSTCDAGGVYVVESDGAATTFCPLGGAGFEVADDGTLRFVFRDLRGRDLTVALAADLSVASVALQALRCRAPSCGGVSASNQGDAADPEVERSFSFSGTTLTMQSPGGRSATLSGSLTMPSQKTDASR